MRIFITGTTGFIGRSLMEHFTKFGHQVAGYVRGTNITDSLNYNKPDLIINCAGEIYNPEPSAMIGTNITMVSEILNWQRNNLSIRLIHLGSSAEYGKVDHPTSEQDRINPCAIYQATKGAGTLLCQGYAHEFGNQTCVARIYSGYGPYERERRLFPTLYRAFFQNEPMTLHDGFHDFIYIDDFCRGIHLLSESEWPTGEIVNFGSGIQTSNQEVLDIFTEVAGKSGLVTYQDGFSRPYESTMWVCDTTYAFEKYRFKTEFTLQQGIADFIKKKHEQNNYHI